MGFSRKLIIPIIFFFIITSCLSTQNKVSNQEDRDAISFNKLVFHYIDQSSPPAHKSTINGFKLSLIHPDDIESPSAWDSPLEITNVHTGKITKTDWMLIEEVYFSNDNKLLLVLNYSGSMKYIDFIELPSAIKKFRRMQFYTGKITVKKNIITAYPGCEDSGEYHECSSGKVIKVDKMKGPILLKKESFELTEKVLGVGFIGDKKVLNPETDKARIVK